MKKLFEPGFTIEKTYKGKELKVTVVDGGYEFKGQTFRSLSGLAKHITGFKSVSGMTFFRIKKEDKTA